MSSNYTEHLDYASDYAPQSEPPSPGCRVELCYLEPGQWFNLDRVDLTPELRVVAQGAYGTLCVPLGGGPETKLDSGRMVSVRVAPEVQA
jgi:hypothetical protein